MIKWLQIQQTKLWLIYTQGPGVKMMNYIMSQSQKSAWDCRQTVQKLIQFFGVFSWAAVHQNGFWHKPFRDSKQRSCKLEASDARWYETVSVHQHYVWAPSVTWVQSLLDPLLGVPAVSSACREEGTRKDFHLNDNTLRVSLDDNRYDPIYKVIPLYETVRMNCVEKYRPGRDISVEEAMVAFTGRLHFKQYIKNKIFVHCWTVWLLAWLSGIHREECSRFIQTRCRLWCCDGTVCQISLQISSHILRQFLCVPLANDLLRRKTCCCSTFRTNRKGWPKNFFSKRMKVVPRCDR